MARTRLIVDLPEGWYNATVVSHEYFTVVNGDTNDSANWDTFRAEFPPGTVIKQIYIKPENPGEEYP